jgi:hypothetical protein
MNRLKHWYWDLRDLWGDRNENGGKTWCLLFFAALLAYVVCWFLI